MPLPRARNLQYQETQVFPIDLASVAATTTVKFAKVKNRKFRVDSVQYINPTGFVQDPANYWAVTLNNGATVAASWSTLTGAQGTIAANTFVEVVPSATDANLVFSDADVMSVVMTKTGAPAALPAGRLLVHGRYV